MTFACPHCGLAVPGNNAFKKSHLGGAECLILMVLSLILKYEVK